MKLFYQMLFLLSPKPDNRFQKVEAIYKKMQSESDVKVDYFAQQGMNEPIQDSTGSMKLSEGFTVWGKRHHEVKLPSDYLQKQLLETIKSNIISDPTKQADEPYLTTKETWLKIYKDIVEEKGRKVHEDIEKEIIAEYINPTIGGSTFTKLDDTIDSGDRSNETFTAKDLIFMMMKEDKQIDYHSIQPCEYSSHNYSSPEWLKAHL